MCVRVCFAVLPSFCCCDFLVLNDRKKSENSLIRGKNGVTLIRPFRRVRAQGQIKPSFWTFGECVDDPQLSCNWNCTVFQIDLTCTGSVEKTDFLQGRMMTKMICIRLWDSIISGALWNVWEWELLPSPTEEPNYMGESCLEDWLVCAGFDGEFLSV